MSTRLLVAAALLVVAANAMLARHARVNRSGVDATVGGLELPLVNGDEQNTAFAVGLDVAPVPREAVPADVVASLGFEAAVVDAVRAGTPVPRASLRRRAWAAVEAGRPGGEHAMEAVAIGPDPVALRARHPDRSRTAIVRVEVGVVFPRPKDGGPQPAAVVGVMAAIPSVVAVPRELRHVFEARPARRSDPRRYRVTLSFGQRLEPWMVAAERRP